MFHLSELLLILPFFLPLQVEDFSIDLLLDLTLLLLKLPLHVSLQLIEFSIVLSLDLALLAFKLFNVASLGFEHLILFVPEFLNFKLVPRPLALLDLAPDALVTGG